MCLGVEVWRKSNGAGWPEQWKEGSRKKTENLQTKAHPNTLT